MIRYISKKMLSGFLVLLGVIFIVFVIFQVMPGDPVSMMLGQRSDEASKKAITDEYALDKPLFTQFSYYINDLSPLSIHEESVRNKEKYNYALAVPVGSNMILVKQPFLRRSFQDNRLVSEVIWEALIRTFWLAITALIFASVVGITLGIIAALNQGSWLDQTLVSLSITGISIPSFVAGVLLSYLFAVHLRDFTGLKLFGYMVQIDPFDGPYLSIKHLFLPALTLGIRPLAIITQLTRSSMLDVLKEDYIRTAKAKGLSTYSVVVKHALRNAINPVITVISGWFASLLAGAFFVESIFSWGGLGSVTVQAVFNKNFPVIMGATLIVAFIFIIINILVDILYSLLDPRVRLT